MKGLINSLKDEHFMSLFLLIPQMGRKDINILLRVSKRFNVLTSSESFWMMLSCQSKHENWISSLWFGHGKEGCEKEEWCQMADDAGLPIMNMFKIHWMSQNTSRLKIYYGILASSTSDDRSSFLHKLLLPSCNSVVKRKIVILGYENGMAYKQAHKLLQQLHYIVPESATQYHLNSLCLPLQRNFVLTEIEASPITSWSRFCYLDPGTRVETHLEHNLLACRRLGDERLTFVQFTANEQIYNHKTEQYSAIIKELYNKTIGNVIVVEYHSCKDIDDEVANHEQQLRNIYKHLQCLYSVATTRSVPVSTSSQRNTADSSRRNGLFLTSMDVSSTYATLCGTNVPILIVVAIQLPTTVSGISTMQTNGIHHQWLHKYKFEYVQNIVQTVGRMMSDIVNKQHTASPVRQTMSDSRLWYVQPVDANSGIGHLRSGVFAGMNWLLRAIQRNNVD